jgi:hypothetical protein
MASEENSERNFANSEKFVTGQNGGFKGRLPVFSAQRELERHMVHGALS